MFLVTDGQISTRHLRRLQGRHKHTSQVPPENVQKVENFIKEMQALDADEVEEEIERRE